MCPKIGFGQFWAKKGPKQAGWFKPAQNYGLNHPCPKLANPDLLISLSVSLFKDKLYVSLQLEGLEFGKQNEN